MENGQDRVYSTLAYRGIDTKNALKFKDSGYLSYSNGTDEYFGHGIYFFENDAREAFNFGKIVRGFDVVHIIEAKIKVEYKYIYDLIDAVTYHEYINFLEDYIKDRYKDSSIVPEIVDCKIINDICNIEKYKLVRGFYRPHNKKGSSLLKKGFTRIEKCHIQLCVKDESIIKNKDFYIHSFV